MDLRWLTAPDDEVAAARATLRRDSRPNWVPSRRQVLVHVNHCLILWYLGIVFVEMGIRSDVLGDGRLRADDTLYVVVTMSILAAWLLGTFWLYRWAKRPPSPKALIAQWRQELTALVNGFEPSPSPVPTFRALITEPGAHLRAYPRFVAPGIEFGNLSGRGRRTEKWQYLAVGMPAPLPHLILDSTSNDGLRSDLPAGVDRGQELVLEGDFGRWFRVYSPVKYRADALYLLTPDLMAALIDEASGFNVEIVDQLTVFFAPKAADFTDARRWSEIERIANSIAGRLARKSLRYLDVRVPGQEKSRVLSAIRAQLVNPGIPWVAPPPRIGPDGRRLDLRDRRVGPWAVVGAVAWVALLSFLYGVPAVFAFAGFMSVVDGW